MTTDDHNDDIGIDAATARAAYRKDYAAYVLAVGVALQDPELRLQGRMAAGGDPMDHALISGRAADLLSEQLGNSRDDAIDNLRAQLARFVARHGPLLDDDEGPLL
ncbi:hypothetical protein [Mycobacterium szulgai]|uniref:Uncharacterized protein n=1 Tax=Mycobacterium szulgai TaxID=1787 RepID=A0A1X2DLC1_MYCSZ|nr:hypothetical protein [Mycobacterium szulgai]MCV7076986.1 hypothetical protein [Mycobacterium szulgai]ORW88794.1 hypothetical protein AWC27_13930 [Mycobacterium szulgai]